MMGTTQQRLAVLVAAVAVLMGGVLPASAAAPEGPQSAPDLPLTPGLSAFAATSVGSAGVQPLALPSLASLKADVVHRLRELLGLDESPLAPERPGTTESEMPVFAGGAGGDEPAGPWP